MLNLIASGWVSPSYQMDGTVRKGPFADEKINTSSESDHNAVRYTEINESTVEEK